MEPTFILPAEHFATVQTDGRNLCIEGLVIPYWETSNGHVDIYVRRNSRDGSIAEIHIADHDGLAQEEIDSLPICNDCANASNNDGPVRSGS